jgi:hypothetical protein
MPRLIDSLLIDGEDLDARVTANLAGGQRIRSMQGAMSLSLRIDDPDGQLLESGVLVKSDRAKSSKHKQDPKAAWQQRLGKVRLVTDGQFYRLNSIDKTGSTVELGFLDEIAALMSQHHRPVVGSRGTYTRLEFIWYELVLAVKERHIITWMPSISKRQKVAPPDPAQTRRGINQAAGVEIQGVAADKEQTRNLNIGLSEADDQNATTRAMLALICAGIGESGWRDIPNATGSPYGGVLQALKTLRLSTQQQAHSFLAGGNGFQAGGAINAAKQNQRWSPGTIAYKVEGSRANFASDTAAEAHYGQHLPEAKKILEAWGGAGKTQVVEINQQYLFHAGSLTNSPDEKPEDYWQAAQRLADEVNMRLFTDDNVLFCAFDADFQKAMPSAMIGEFPTPGEASAGVQQVGPISFSFSAADPFQEASLTAPTDQWFAFPGAVVEVVGARSGPAAGKHLMWEHSQGLDSAVAQITLRRPAPAKPEPAPAKITLTDRQGNAISDTVVGRAYAKAKQIDARRYDYAWGGGHNQQFSGPYDCSGGVSAVLHAAGILDAPLSTVGLAAWGNAGRGRGLTVWVHETGVATQSHTFLEFTHDDGTSEFWEAGGTSGAHTGFRTYDLTPAARGFRPRHWPGT